MFHVPLILWIISTVSVWRRERISDTGSVSPGVRQVRSGRFLEIVYPKQSRREAGVLCRCGAAESRQAVPISGVVLGDRFRIGRSRAPQRWRQIAHCPAYRGPAIFAGARDNAHQRASSEHDGGAAGATNQIDSACSRVDPLQQARYSRRLSGHRRPRKRSYAPYSADHPVSAVGGSGSAAG
jgi:hypothetical protein